MAKTFKPKKQEISAVQWDGSNEDEFNAFILEGTATKRGRSLVVSSKNFMSLLNQGDWLAKEGDKLKTYTDESFKEKFDEKNETKPSL